MDGTADISPAIWRRLLHRLADLLVPPVCLSCRCPLGSHHALCAACWSDVAFIRDPVCQRMGLPLPFDLTQLCIIEALLVGGIEVLRNGELRQAAEIRRRALRYHPQLFAAT